ncbi:UNVERIFIED_CONTAM: Embryonic polyadenylate-binding protein 2, partial [Gekko kuhli]
LPFCSLTAEKVEADHRSIYVGNVDYEGSAEELESHFNSCGEINRVTILCDKFSGHPKGYAYIEFADRRSVQAAVGLDETTFRGRIIKVHPKRTNMPGISTTDRGGFRGRFHSRGGAVEGYQTGVLYPTIAGPQLGSSWYRKCSLGRGRYGGLEMPGRPSSDKSRYDF